MGGGAGFGLPSGILAMDSAGQLSLSGVPFTRLLEGNVRSGMVNESEGAHPEVEAQPRQHPPLDESDRTGHHEQWEQSEDAECRNRSQAHLHSEH